jgi:hypothetical protein
MNLLDHCSNGTATVICFTKTHVLAINNKGEYVVWAGDSYGVVSGDYFPGTIEGFKAATQKFYERARIE